MKTFIKAFDELKGMKTYEVLLRFRDIWSRMNYNDFMEAFFSDIPTDSPRYNDEYHMNRWTQFRDSPLVFFSEVDMQRRNAICQLIENDSITEGN